MCHFGRTIHEPQELLLGEAEEVSDAPWPLADLPDMEIVRHGLGWDLRWLESTDAKLYVGVTQLQERHDNLEVLLWGLRGRETKLNTATHSTLQVGLVVSRAERASWAPPLVRALMELQLSNAQLLEENESLRAKEIELGDVERKEVEVEKDRRGSVGVYQ